MVTPALGPSLGVAPSGTCRCIEAELRNLLSGVTSWRNVYKGGISILHVYSVYLTCILPFTSVYFQLSILLSTSYLLTSILLSISYLCKCVSNLCRLLHHVS